jgi:large subunit ribosomal protein L30
VGTNPSARGTVRALGLRRIGQSVELADDEATRGQVRAVRYLLDVEELGVQGADGPAPAKAGSGRRAAPPKRSSTPSKPAAASTGRVASTARKKEAQS